MKYQVLETFKVKTSEGERELPAGQVITLPKEKALRLLNEGKIAPMGRATYKVFSGILQAHLWVVEDDEDTKALRTSQDVTEAIYTTKEIRTLKGMDHDSLTTINTIKEIFEYSTVEEIKQSTRRQE